MLNVWEYREPSLEKELHITLDSISIQVLKIGEAAHSCSVMKM